MAVESVPEVLAGNRVPGPVRGLGVPEDDPGSLIHLVGVAPDVVVSLGRGRVAAGLLKPRVLVGRMVDHEVGDDSNATRVGGLGERLEVRDGADRGMDLPEIGDVVTVVLQGRGIDRHEPEAIDTQLLQVVELGGQPGQIAVAVAVGVVKTPGVNLVKDGVLVPQAFVSSHFRRSAAGDSTRVGTRVSRRFQTARAPSRESEARVLSRPSATAPRPRPGRPGPATTRKARPRN